MFCVIQALSVRKLENFLRGRTYRRPVLQRTPLQCMSMGNFRIRWHIFVDDLLLKLPLF